MTEQQTEKAARALRDGFYPDKPSTDNNWDAARPFWLRDFAVIQGHLQLAGFSIQPINPIDL